MNDPVITFRLATPDDAEALHAIYEPYLATSITFECSVPTVEQFRGRIEERIKMYPYIVCEEDGVPAGYAYASRMFEREAYAWAVELSVYFRQDIRGRGLGRVIYGKLLELLDMQGVRSAHGKVTHPNEKSERLHVSMGFERVGTLKNVGYKLGEWRDVYWYEKQFDAHHDEDGNLLPVTPFPELDPAAVQEVLTRPW